LNIVFFFDVANILIKIKNQNFFLKKMIIISFCFFYYVLKQYFKFDKNVLIFVLFFDKYQDWL